MRNHTLLNRRDALRSALIGTAGVALSGNLLGKSMADPILHTNIDAHSHIWTTDLENYPLAQGQTVDDLKPASFTPEALLELARANRVGRVVLIQHQPYHGFDNSYVIDSAAKYPNEFRIVGQIDDRKPEPDALMWELLSQRVTGFRVTSMVYGAETWLDGPGMAAMWKCGAETRQAMCCLIGPEDMAGVDKMCHKYPETPVVIDHFARVGMDGTIRDADIKQLCNLARHANTYCKVSAFYALGKKQPPYLDLGPMIRRLYDTFGPERLMWASDAPYQMDGDNSYQASIELVRDKLDFLTDADRQWLLRKTAEQVFFFV